jgi:predicted enzyme related to lactoylglutathione lyase
MPDGSIGHAELAIGDAVLMLSDSATGEVPVAPPTGGPHSHTVHVQLPDVDATLALARESGATVEREPVDQPYGRTAAMVDPFGHRWLLLQPPGRATRLRHGDIGYVTVVVPDGEAARDFYSGVLGWQLRAGTVEDGWQAHDVNPMVGLWGGSEGPAAVELCYRVSDAAAAARRVTEHGGAAGAVERRSYGLMVECTDDQGLRFQLWEPTD